MLGSDQEIPNNRQLPHGIQGRFAGASCGSAMNALNSESFD